MIFHSFSRTPRADSIARLYGMIVAQARAPAFYRIYEVPDTVTGRFEMLVLHAVLLLRRLAGEPEPLRRLGQAIFDRFCSDMDANMREMGVGDLTVPKKMHRVGAAFYDRQGDYQAALATPEGLLATALAQHIYQSNERPAQAERLATYVRAAARHLADQDSASLARGECTFPAPEDHAAADAVARMK
jgi:cytochrome b pre-mRNA-processing protein 3